MNLPVQYIDRQTGQLCEEQIYFEKWLRFFYGHNPLGKWLGNRVAKNALFSKIVGYLQSLPSSKRKIAPFVSRYQIDLQEAICPQGGFSSFNAFFTRKLKEEARPIAPDPLIIPSDGRFLLYPNISDTDGFIVKGDKFSLAKFLGSDALAAEYAGGSLLLARLCPTDYHRFHFPCDCVPGHARVINGHLHSVSPIAIRENIHRLTENKRVVTNLRTEHYGNILYCEIGATNVGSIQQTYTANRPYRKGDEKGYFEFGGSALLLLFEPGQIAFAEDLQLNSMQHIETLCLFGQSLGKQK